MKSRYFARLAMASALALAACGVVTSVEPVVASFNESSVGIQLDGNAMDFASEEVRQQAIAAADAKAAEICSRGPNRRAEYASERRFSTSQYSYARERLYLCLR